MFNAITINALLILLVFLFLLWRYHQKDAIVKNQRKGIADLEKALNDLKSQKRSLETIYGNAVENLVPFIDEFKDLDPKEFRQLGKPIDYIYFGDDKIIIIEVKSGNAKLNSTQRRIRDLVKEGKVEFKEIRIKR